jgi:hypothetical protein
LGIKFRHRALDCQRTLHRVDDAGEFQQQPITGGLDDAAAVRGN